MSLRNNVFVLCKKIQKDDSYTSLRSLIHDLHIVPDPIKDRGRSDFGYIAKHGNSQFYGYLFTDENVDSYQQDVAFKALTHLSTEERSLIEQGQATLNLLISECLSDLENKYPHITKALNPYSKFKPIKPVLAQPYIDLSELTDCINSFKNSPAYIELLNSPMSPLLASLSEEQSLTLVAVVSRELSDKSPENVSEDIKTMALRYLHTSKTQETMLFHDSCLMIALREMLRITCQLIFSAFVGGDIIVVNNDNIINIEKNASSAFSKYMTVLVQGGLFIPAVGVVGNVILIDCDPSEDYHIHEFGFIYSETFSFSQDEGDTSKVSFTILDEHLNMFGSMVGNK